MFTPHIVMTFWVLVDGDRGALGCVLVELIVRDDSIEESHIQLIPIVCFFCKINDHRYQGEKDQLTDEGKSFGNHTYNTRTLQCSYRILTRLIKITKYVKRL